MKYRNEIVVSLFIIVSLIFTTYIWEKINLPFNDPGILGEYSDFKFNPLNDIFRYLTFLLIPILIFIFQIFFDNKKKKNLIFNLKDESISELKKNDLSPFIIIIFCLLIFLEFLSLDFQTHNLDLMHEGQQLSSAYKSLIDGSLWSGSYITTGIFYETISTKLIWNIFNFESIGLKRLTDIILILVLKLLLIILTYQITKFLNLNKQYKNIFFVLCSLIFLSIIDYNIISVDHFSSREIPVLILLIILINFFQNNQTNKFVIFIFGFLSICSLLWGIDRGLVINLVIFNLALFFLFRKNYKFLGILLGGIISWWLLFYFILGIEFKYFLENTISIYKYMSYIHGIIHPTPFSDHPDSSRATKTLISLVLICILTINLFFKKDKNFPNSFKYSASFLALIAVLSYIYVVGRSDGPHIKHIFGYPIIFFSIYISYLFLIRLNEKISLQKNNLVNFFLIILMIGYFINNNKLNFNNIKNYQTRLDNYINLPDNVFLNNEEINFIKKAEPHLKNSNCLQLFTHDAALPYLLKKKNCTKYYLIWSVGSIPDQENLIAELKNTEIIISKGSKFNWLKPLDERLYLVNNYIVDNFENFKVIENWNILKRVKN